MSWAEIRVTTEQKAGTKGEARRLVKGHLVNFFFIELYLLSLFPLCISFLRADLNLLLHYNQAYTPGSGQGGPADGSDKFLLASKQGPRRAVWPAYSKSRRRSSDGATGEGAESFRSIRSLMLRGWTTHRSVIETQDLRAEDGPSNLIHISDFIGEA